MSLGPRQALEMVTATYKLGGTTEGWLQSALAAVSPALPAGVFLALETDLATAEPKSAIVAGPNADEAHVRFLSEAHERAPQWVVKATYGSGRSWISLRECVRDDYFFNADWLDDLHGFGLKDMLAVVSKHEKGERPSCALFSLCEAPAQASPNERRLWERVALHLGAAQRLRNAAPNPPDAVLAPDGTCLHATHAAARERKALRELVKRWDRAHAQIPDRDVEASLDFWNELATGRWSLVDHFDSDGRRYVVARENPHVDPLRRLTHRERSIAEYAAQGRTNTWIALELQLTGATISEHLKHAQRKLGGLSRAELIQLVNSARPFSPAVHKG